MDNYIIKWEVFPEKYGEKIEIYSSLNDKQFPKSPVKTMFVNDYIAILPQENKSFREFFKLKAGKTSSGIITNRFFNNIKEVQNFRDLGGYFTKTEKQVKWGKLYRSGSLSRMDSIDIALFDSLHIKTIIDLRSNEQVKHHPTIYSPKNSLQIPIEESCFNKEIKQRILDETFFKGDAIVYTQDCYRTIIEKYPHQFAQMFDIFGNEEYYPIVFHCDMGKDRTALATYFILKALDVSNDDIELDYLLSNDAINGIRKRQVITEGNQLPEAIQEAITVLTTSDLSQLKYAISCMKKKSGSVEEYMIKELNLTYEKRSKLKEILLYN